MSQSRSLPRNIQISERLIREITSGLLPDGARLPSERQMAEDYGVAVGTLRKALSVLEGKGLLERVQGSGNYIRRKGKVSSIYSHFHLELIGGGGLPTAKILTLDTSAPPPAARAFGFTDIAFRIDRLRSLNGSPVALERIWLNGTYDLSLQTHAISESLYTFYQEHLGLIISRIEDSVGISQMPDWSPSPDLKPNSVAGFIERYARDQSGQAAEFSQTWFDSNRARYINRSDA